MLCICCRRPERFASSEDDDVVPTSKSRKQKHNAPAVPDIFVNPTQSGKGRSGSSSRVNVSVGHSVESHDGQRSSGKGRSGSSSREDMNENIARYTESRESTDRQEESTDRQRSSVKGRSGSSSRGNVSHSHESVDRQDTTRQHSTPLVTTPSGARTVLSDNPVRGRVSSRLSPSHTTCLSQSGILVFLAWTCILYYSKYSMDCEHVVCLSVVEYK